MEGENDAQADLVLPEGPVTSSELPQISTIPPTPPRQSPRPIRQRPAHDHHPMRLLPRHQRTARPPARHTRTPLQPDRSPRPASIKRPIRDRSHIARLWQTHWRVLVRTRRLYDLAHHTSQVSAFGRGLHRSRPAKGQARPRLRRSARPTRSLRRHLDIRQGSERAYHPQRPPSSAGELADSLLVPPQ